LAVARSFYRLLFFAALIFCLGVAGGTSLGDELASYEKRSSRQETLEATLQAAGHVVLGPWSQVGPFDPILRRPQSPQLEPDEEKYRLWRGGEGSWQAMPGYADGYLTPLDLAGWKSDLLAKRPTICLKRKLIAPQATSLRVFLGCDAGMSLWLNGRPVFYSDTMRECQPGEEVAELPLESGENTLVMKIAVSRETCRFFFLPDFGRDWTEQLVARLDQDFPQMAALGDGYRRRAVRESVEAESRYWNLVEIPTPEGVVIEGGGMDFLPSGQLVVSTRRGFVYLIDAPGSGELSEIKFHRFAAGLHDALGLRVVDGHPVVANRGELTRLIDTDGDGRADRYESLSNDWGLTGNYHEYAYGPEIDDQGRYYLALNLSFPPGGSKSEARYRGCVIRIGANGETELVATGLRSPNGVGKNAAGDIFVTDNQGEWVAACPLIHVQEEKFYGHPASAHWQQAESETAAGEIPPRTLPAVWLPYEELCQSATEVVCDTTEGRFGPFSEQLFVGEMTKGLVIRVQLERVADEYQGACFLFRRGCGAVNRLTFGPAGKLYFARCNRGWGGGGLGEGLARLEFTGNVPMEVHSIRAEPDGFTIHWTKPLAAGSGERPEDYDLEQFGYQYWSKYGSPKIDVTPLPVKQVQVAEDRRSVRLRIEGLQPEKVCSFQFGVVLANDGEPLLHDQAFYSLNHIPEEPSSRR